MDRLKNSSPAETKINGGVLNVVRQDIMLRIASEIQLGNNLISLLLASAQNANEENIGQISADPRERLKGTQYILREIEGRASPGPRNKSMGQSALLQPTPTIHFKTS